MLRMYVEKRLSRAGIAKIEIERRTSNQITVNIHTARPGIVIGRKGMEVDKLRDELKLLTKKDVFLNIVEVKHPEIEAKLVADGIARQLEQRVCFMCAPKKSVTTRHAARCGGVRIACSGRLGGAEMSRHDASCGTRSPSYASCRHRLRDFHRVHHLRHHRSEGVAVEG